METESKLINEDRWDTYEFTKEFWPEKISLDEFINLVKTSCDPFKENMISLKGLSDSRFIEEWFCLFKRWNDCKQERDLL